MVRNGVCGSLGPISNQSFGFGENRLSLQEPRNYSETGFGEMDFYKQKSDIDRDRQICQDNIRTRNKLTVIAAENQAKMTLEQNKALIKVQSEFFKCARLEKSYEVVRRGDGRLCLSVNNPIDGEILLPLIDTCDVQLIEFSSVNVELLPCLFRLDWQGSGEGYFFKCEELTGKVLGRVFRDVGIQINVTKGKKFDVLENILSFLLKYKDTIEIPRSVGWGIDVNGEISDFILEESDTYEGGLSRAKEYR